MMSGSLITVTCSENILLTAPPPLPLHQGSGGIPSKLCLVRQTEETQQAVGQVRRASPEQGH